MPLACRWAGPIGKSSAASMHRTGSLRWVTQIFSRI